MTAYIYIPPPAGAPWSGTVQSSDMPNRFIPCDLANRDYQEFLVWLAQGNPAPEGWTGPLNPTPDEVA